VYILLELLRQEQGDVFHRIVLTITGPERAPVLSGGRGEQVVFQRNTLVGLAVLIGVPTGETGGFVIQDEAFTKCEKTLSVPIFPRKSSGICLRHDDRR
jgi:hypothetical protein